MTQTPETPVATSKGQMTRQTAWERIARKTDRTDYGLQEPHRIRQGHSNTVHDHAGDCELVPNRGCGQKGQQMRFTLAPGPFDQHVNRLEGLADERRAYDECPRSAAGIIVPPPAICGR